MLPVQLFSVPFDYTLIILVFMFLCILMPMFLLPSMVPSIVSDIKTDSSWIDGLRGIAASIVALNHAPLVMINLHRDPKAFYYDLPLHPLFNFFGSVGVQIFFCITGMLFANKIMASDKIDWQDFYLKRVFRIAPAYFSACTIALCIALWYCWPVVGDLKNMIQYIPSIFSFGLMPLPEINGFNFNRLLGVNWTLAIEWRFYIALPFIFILMKYYKKTTLGLIVTFGFLDSYLTNSSTWVFFLSGAVCVPFMNKYFNGMVASCCSIIAISLVVFLSYNWNVFPSYGFARWLIISAIFFFIVIAKPALFKLRLVVSMGVVSYSFYLFHSMLIFAFFAILDRYCIDISTISLKNFTLLTGAILSLATVIASASYLVIERPFMKKAHHKKKTAPHVKEDMI